MRRFVLMKKIILFLAFLLSFFSCKEEDFTNIPDARVYLTLTLDDYSSFKNGIGNSLVCPRDLKTKDMTGASYGYGGLILFHTMDSERVFVAYDRTCPFEVKASVKINVDGGQGVCPQCGSVFDLLTGYGAVVSGKAKYPLRSYTVHVYTSSVRGDELQVVN